jgi:parallel beta-helix repeat protein
MPAHAAVGINQKLNFQGRLLTNTGAVVPDGNYNMRFKIYQDGNGVLGGGDETLKWTETWQNSATNGVTVKNGYYSVALGTLTAFGSSVDWNQDTLWLSMEVTTNGTDTGGTPTWNGEMSPFRRLSSAVYALNAGQLGGLSSAQYVQLAQGIQTDASTTQASIAINKTAGSQNLITLQASGSDILTIGSTGNTLHKTTTNSTAAFQIQNASSVNLFAADTVNADLGVTGRLNVTKSSATTSEWNKLSQASSGTIASGGTSGIDEVQTAVVYNGSIYVGTTESNGAEVYRYDGGTTWTKVTQATAGTIAAGGTANIDGVRSMVVHGGTLYIGTRDGAAGGEVYRYDGGTTWTRVTSAGGTITSGGTTSIDRVQTLVSFNGSLYAGTNESNLAEIYKYVGGTTWTKVSQATAGTIASGGTASIDAIEKLAVFGSSLYAGTSESNAGEIYRYDGGTTWTKVSQATAGTIASGGTTGINGVPSMTVYDGKLYAGTAELNDGEVYRYDGGTTWTKVSQTTAGTIASGGTADINGVEQLTVYNGALYAGTEETDGAEIYRYDGGTTWTKVSQTTAGTVALGGTASVDEIQTLIPHAGSLYAGTNEPNAAEVLRYSDSLLSVANSDEAGVVAVGNAGNVLLQNSTNSTTAFQVANASGAAILNVDTTNGRVGIGTSSPTEMLQVANGNILATSQNTSQSFEGSESFPSELTPGVWTTGGNANWASTTPGSGAQQGTKTATSGTISDSQSTWLDWDYTFTGDSVVRFWWRVDSESSFDFLLVCIDNDSCTRTTGYTYRISGNTNVNWQEVSIPLAAGSHSIRWLYAKDTSAVAGADTGWLDNIRIFEQGIVSGTRINAYESITVGTAGTNNGTIDLAGNFSTSTGGNAKIFVGKQPTKGTDGSLNGSSLNQIADYGTDEEGIIMQYGGSTDAGGIKLTDQGMIVWGSGNGDLFTVLDEDFNNEVIQVGNNGDTLFRTTQNTSKGLQLQNAAEANVFSASTVNSNVIRNPDMEDWTGNVNTLDDWDDMGSNATVTRDSTTSKEGDYSGKVAITPATANAGFDTDLGAALTTSTQYTLSFYVKLGTGTAWSTANIDANYERNGSTEDANCSGWNTANIVTTGWTRVSCTFTTSSTAGTTSADLNIYQTDAAAREWYIDSVQLEPTSAINHWSPGSISLNAPVVSSLILQNAENSTDAFHLLNAAGAALLSANTINSTITINADTTITAGKSLIVTGSTSFPSSPVEGQTYYRSDKNQLYTYDATASRWRATRSGNVKVIADADTTPDPEGADYLVPTGNTSAEDTINSAITDLSTNGGTIVLREGTYIIDGTINLNDNITLTGSGAKTVVYLKNSTNTTMNMISTNGDDKVVISNFTLDGNKANQSSGTIHGILIQTSGSGSGATAVPGTEVYGMTLQNTEHDGIEMLTALNSKIHDNHFIATGAWSVWIGAASANVTVSNNTIQGSGFGGVATDGSGGTDPDTITVSGNLIEGTTEQGIEIAYSARVNVTGNVIRDAGLAGIGIVSSDSITVADNTIFDINNGGSNDGIEVTAPTGSSTSISVLNNNIRNVEDYGIRLDDDVAYSTVSGNIIRDSGVHGIYATNTDDSNISNNTIRDSGTITTTADGINIGADSDRNLITGNIITDSAGTGEGIRISDSTADFNALAANKFSGTGAESLTNSGTGTIMYGQATSENGNFRVRPGANSINFYQLQDASGNEIFNVDASNSKIGTINKTAASTHSTALTIKTGDASGTTSNSGNLTIDTGSATGTAGSLSIGTGAYSHNTTLGSLTGTSTLTLQSGTGNINLQAAGTGAVARVQIGAGGAGGTTPDYLALDVKSDTGDPAGGAEGYMYYNTFDNKFRCYQNTGWTDCIGAGGSTTLAQAYTAGSAGDQTIALTTSNDSIVINNPSSNGTDSAYLLALDNDSTGAVGGLNIESAGSGNLLKITDTTSTASDVMTIANGGAATLKNQTNSTAAFQIQRSNSDPLFVADTTNNKILVGKHQSSATPGYLAVDEYSSGGTGSAQVTGNWNASSNWGLGTNTASSDSTLRIGSVTDGTRDWDTTSNLNLLVAGTQLVKPAVNSTTAMRIQDASGDTFFNADSTQQILTVQDVNVGEPGELNGRGRAFSDNFESVRLNYWTEGATGSAAIQSSIARSGNNAVRVNPTAATAYVGTTFDPESTISARAAVYASSVASLDIMEFYIDSTHYVKLRTTAGGVLEVDNWLNGSSSVITSGTTLTASTWQRVEMRVIINGASGHVLVRLDDVSTSINGTQNTGGSQLGIFDIGTRTTTKTQDFYIDDVAVDGTLMNDSASLNVNDTLHVGGNATVSGVLHVASANNTTNAFRVFTQADVALLGVDTTNSRVGIGPGAGGSPTHMLDVAALSGNANLRVSTAQSADLFSIGASTGDSNKIWISSENGTRRQAMMLADASASTDVIWGVSTSSDTGGTWNPAVAITQGGSTTFKNASNTTAAFQIQNAAGNSLFTANTSATSIVLLAANNGEINTFTTAGNVPAAGRQYPGAVIYNGYMYIVGGANTSPAGQTSIYYAKLNADGTPQTWTTSSVTLPGGRFAGGVQVVNGFLYMYGGADGTPNARDTFYYARINPVDGSLGTMQTETTNDLTSTRSGFASVSLNGYIYHIDGEGTYNTTGSINADANYSRVGSDGVPGTWSSAGTTSLLARRYPASVAANNYIYLIGGQDTTPTSTTTVQYTSQNKDGTLGTWATTSALPAALDSASAAVANGYVYLTGGRTNGTASNAVYYAKINTDGTLGSWSTSARTLGAARYGNVTLAANGYLYSVHGYNGSSLQNSIEMSPLPKVQIKGDLDLVGQQGVTYTDAGGYAQGSAGGNLTAGNTRVVGTLNVQGDASFAAGVTINRGLTVGSGFANDESITVTSAISSALKLAGDTDNDGSELGTAYLQMTQDNSAVLSTLGTIQNAQQDSRSNTYYGTTSNATLLGSYAGDSDVQIGTNTNAGTPAVRLTVKHTTGYVGIGTNTPTGPLSVSPIVYSTGTAYQSGTTITGVGTNWSNANGVYVGMRIVFWNGSNTDAGIITNINSTTSLTVTTSQTVSSNPGTQYRIHSQGLNVSTTGATSVQAASTTAFQVQNSSAASLFNVDTSASNIQILGNNAATLSTWTTTTALSATSGSTNPTHRARSGAVAANGYLYQIGGNDGDGNVTAVTQYAKLNADGTVGSWTATTSLPLARRQTQPVVYNGYIYVIGGRQSGSGAETTSYYAKLNNDGTIGTWNTTTALSAGRFSGATAAYNGHIYYFGGHDSTPSASANVYYAQINPDGTLGSWTLDGDSLPFSVGCINNSSTIANGYVYIAGGCSAGSAPDDVYYAKIAADGTPGSWTNQSGVITREDSENFALFTANGYLYVVGGDFNDHTNAFALNANGSVGTEIQLDDIGTTTQGESANAYYNGYFYLLGGSNTSDGGGTTRNTVYYASVPRVKVGASLDLVSYGGENMHEGRTGGTLTAGDTRIVGTLEVADAAHFINSVSVNGDFSVGGKVNFKNASNSTSAFQVQNASGTSMFTVDTTNARLYVGPVAGDTVGTILVLGKKTNAGDPTGVEGAMYYNSNTKKFRCYVTDHWRDCIQSARSRLYVYSDFMAGQVNAGSTADESMDFYGSSSGTGTFDTELATAVAGRPGIGTASTGTGTTGRMYIGSKGNHHLVLGNNDTYRFETAVSLSALSDGTDTYTFRAGFIDQGGTESTDGCFFRYTHSANSGKWLGVCRSNNVETASTCDAGTTVAAATWYRLNVNVNSAASSADFQINGTSACQVTANIPASSARATGYGVQILKSLGTTARSFDIDYMEVIGDLATPR